MHLYLALFTFVLLNKIQSRQFTLENTSKEAHDKEKSTG